MYLNLQVEPNAQKIEEHRRKYERLRRERELKKIERDRQQKRAAAQVIIKTYHEVSSIIKMLSIFHILHIILQEAYKREKKMEHTSESKTSVSCLLCCTFVHSLIHVQ